MSPEYSSILFSTVVQLICSIFDWTKMIFIADAVAPWRMNTGFSLGLNDRAQRPVVVFSALPFSLSALSFFQRPVIFLEPFGFFGLSSALFWAWSCRKRPTKAKGGAIFVHHVAIRVGHRRHLGFTLNINLCKLVRPVVIQDQLEHWNTSFGSGHGSSK